MKLIYKLSLFLLTLIFINCSSENNNLCIIKGTVINSDTKSIILIKPYQDMRFDSIIEIPVVNGQFEYITIIDNPEAYTLMLGKAKNIGGRFMPLFLESGNIKLTIHSENEFDKNIIQGGKLNMEFKNFQKIRDSIFMDRITHLQDSLDILSENNLYNSDEMNTFLTELRNTKNQDNRLIIYKKINDLRKLKQGLSKPAGKINDKLKLVYSEQKKWELDYISNNLTVVSYYLFLTDLISYKEKIDIIRAKQTFKKLSKKLPKHPYNEIALNLINAITNIKVGEKYVDFSAPDLEGNIITLSDKIDGKMALIDLWATWCGPCIAKSRTMLPIYNEFNKIGFIIIGVAGEFKNTDRLKKFLKKEKYPWLNLVELDKQNSIWQKYGVDGSGGAMFLVDKSGIIIAVNPTAKEVRNKLKSLLN